MKISLDRRRIGLIMGAGCFALILGLADLQPGNPAVTRMAATAVLVAVWWVTEALPIPATSLVPIVLLPALGIVKGEQVAAAYMNSSIMLFLGGFIIALAMERCNLHRRLALAIIGILGGSRRRIVLGFMSATALLSMWISNTATTMMMLPIAVAVLSGTSSDDSAKGTGDDRFALALLLGVAYGASIGGIGTLIGTPPNIVLARIHAMAFPDAPPVTFSRWLVMGLPATVLLFTSTYFVLTRWPVRLSAEGGIGNLGFLRIAKSELGPIRAEERRTALVFALTALLWMTRAGFDLGRFKVPGWAELLHLADWVDDGTVAVGMALTLFLIPRGEGAPGRLMDWKTAGRLPWGVLLLFGGGFALADGFQKSGLSAWLGEWLKGTSNIPLTLVVAGVCTLVTFMTELTSNTATANVILPVLAATAAATGLPPLVLMVPATLSASCAFMLPVGTPPNAIVFGTGRVPIAKMAAVGFVLNWVGVGVITALSLTIGRWLWGG